MPSVVSECQVHLIASQKKVPAKTDVVSREQDPRVRVRIESRCPQSAAEVGDGGH